MATVTINVAAVPQTPVAQPDTYGINENTTLTVAAPGVLGNDSDPNGALLTAVLSSSPSHGSVTLNADGSFTYTPAPYFSGTDSFTYQATNGQKASAPATVTIAVTSVLLPPTTGNSGFAMQADDRLNVPAPGILGTVVDPQGLPLRAIVVNPTLNGSLSLNADGSFSYTPNPGFVGTDSFTFRAGDGQLSSSLSTVTIDVGAIPGTTVGLAPSVPDRGGFTNDSAPSFTGTTLPGVQVLLYGQAAGGAPMVVGQTQSDSSGHYTVASGGLPDGSYHFWVDPVRPNGISTGSVEAGNLTISTAAPRITDVFIVPRTGQIMITFQTGPGGIDLSSVANPANYSFSRLSTPGPRNFVITSATLVPPASATGPVMVVLTSSIGKPIPRGRYLFEILAGGITDLAGNHLAGQFNGGFPTGGGPGSSFDALFISKNRKPSHPVATNHFIPVLTHQNGPTRARTAAARLASAALPAGPMALVTARGQGIASVRLHRHHAS